MLRELRLVPREKDGPCLLDRRRDGPLGTGSGWAQGGRPHRPTGLHQATLCRYQDLLTGRIGEGIVPDLVCMRNVLEFCQDVR